MEWLLTEICTKIIYGWILFLFHSIEAKERASECVTLICKIIVFYKTTVIFNSIFMLFILYVGAFFSRSFERISLDFRQVCRWSANLFIFSSLALEWIFLITIIYIFAFHWSRWKKRIKMMKCSSPKKSIISSSFFLFFIRHSNNKCVYAYRELQNFDVIPSFSMYCDDAFVLLLSLSLVHSISQT